MVIAGWPPGADASRHEATSPVPALDRHALAAAGAHARCECPHLPLLAGRLAVNRAARVDTASARADDRARTRRASTADSNPPAKPALAARLPQSLIQFLSAALAQALGLMWLLRPCVTTTGARREWTGSRAASRGRAAQRTHAGSLMRSGPRTVGSRSRGRRLRRVGGYDAAGERLTSTMYSRGGEPGGGPIE